MCPFVEKKKKRALSKKPPILFFQSRPTPPIIRDSRVAISDLSGKFLKTVEQSAASDNLPECNYLIDFDHFDVLTSRTNKFRFLLRKVYSINVNKSRLGKTNSFPLRLLS